MAIIVADDLKAHLAITDQADDATIDAAVNAANSAVVFYCGRDFTDAGSATARTYRPTSQLCLVVDDFSTTTGLVVKTDDNDDGTFETTWTLDTHFYLEPLNGKRYGQTWPYSHIEVITGRVFPTWTRRPSVQVTARWGWATIPAPVFEATLLIAARVWKRKNSPEGVIGGFADFTAVRVSSRQDPDAAMLLAPYRHPHVVALVG